MRPQQSKYTFPSSPDLIVLTWQDGVWNDKYIDSCEIYYVLGKITVIVELKITK